MRKNLPRLPLLLICLFLAMLSASFAWLLLTQLGLILTPETTAVFLGCWFLAGVLTWLACWLWLRRHLAKEGPQAFESTDAAKAPEAKAKTSPTDPPMQVETDSMAALQMLSILQREGRLVDFLWEDLSHFDDAQIGAAVRSVHQGCRAALQSHLTLEPVLEQREGSTVTVEKGFDPSAIRLTGAVHGEPPFHGVLQHGGWRVTKLQLPDLLPLQRAQQEWIVAPAEVEMSS